LCNKLVDKITFRILGKNEEGDEVKKELVIQKDGKECLYVLPKGIYTYEVVLPNKDIYKKGEQFYRQRDVDLPQIKSIVQNSAAVLKSIYAKNPKVLGDYGLVVDDTPKVKNPK